MMARSVDVTLSKFQGCDEGHQKDEKLHTIGRTTLTAIRSEQRTENYNHSLHNSTFRNSIYYSGAPTIMPLSLVPLQLVLNRLINRLPRTKSG